MPRRILLGVSGSIAAFKAAQLASDLVKEGYEVRAVLTPGATRFVAPLTFHALSGHPAGVEIWGEEGGSGMGHLDLANWAEAIVVAPASAGVLARLALGLPEDLLGAVALASEAPLLLVPAMETTMHHHPATQDHLETLKQRGARVIGPASGRLASGAEGEGRMAEVAEILAGIRQILGPRDLEGKRVLVTAGPTYEPIDPVRFLGNRSSGKMGYAVAEEARDRGADVTLVSGPTVLTAPSGLTFVSVETATEMHQAVTQHAIDADVVVMAAAVADFRPRAVSERKIKRGEGLTLDLEQTSDIAAQASQAAPRAIHVGFALESENLQQGALAKLRRKGQNLVVANLISPEHNPFGADRNRVAFITENEVVELPEMLKREVARALWDRVVDMMAPTESF